MTREERDNTKRMVEEAKEKTKKLNENTSEDTNEKNWIFKVRGPPWDQKIVKIRRQTQH